MNAFTMGRHPSSDVALRNPTTGITGLLRVRRERPRGRRAAERG